MSKDWRAEVEARTKAATEKAAAKSPTATIWVDLTDVPYSFFKAPPDRNAEDLADLVALQRVEDKIAGAVRLEQMFTKDKNTKDADKERARAERLREQEKEMRKAIAEKRANKKPPSDTD